MSASIHYLTNHRRAHLLQVRDVVMVEEPERLVIRYQELRPITKYWSKCFETFQKSAFEAAQKRFDTLRLRQA